MNLLFQIIKLSFELNLTCQDDSGRKSCRTVQYFHLHVIPYVPVKDINFICIHIRYYFIPSLKVTLLPQEWLFVSWPQPPTHQTKLLSCNGKRQLAGNIFEYPRTSTCITLTMYPSGSNRVWCTQVAYGATCKSSQGSSKALLQLLTLPQLLQHKYPHI